jgi:prepilin-type N-terminal cleavage/methylation domain-containing protein
LKPNARDRLLIMSEHYHVCSNSRYRENHQPAPGFALRAGFTLIELLTVIAIIAVLATLLMTTLGAAKKRSRQAYCTSNLRQISLAFDMYVDDAAHRPADFAPLFEGKYLHNRFVLICREDKTGNWGGLVNQEGSAFSRTLMPVDATAPEAPAEEPLRYSYLHPWSWTDDAWTHLISAGSSAGVAVCQLHGLGKPNPQGPSIYDYEGLLLRAQRDGAVVRRQLFWSLGTPPPPASPTSVLDFAETRALGNNYPWRLYLDETPPTPP